jgi:short-subunit dehydrogenase
MRQRFGSALVTGASSGIGYELAAELARHGHDLVICAEDDRLAGAAEQLRQLGAHVESVHADLRHSAAVEQLWATATTAGRPLSVACLNAGVGAGGAFVDIDLADDLALIEVNVASTVHLAKLVLRDMVGRGAGRVLITSSVASSMPGPFQATYNASKSFLQSFAEALQSELKDSGVTVTSLMPGPTDTDFFRRARLLNTALGQGPKDDPAAVARKGVQALLSGRPKVVTGTMNKVMVAGNRLLPDRVKALTHRGMAKPRSSGSSEG